ncbi:hypothetical protein DSBG_4501 [Desulfosporosinus sp. BG]|nr:hypothetical protein DSBG_4501 [Desulfosporosinus sp. BG]
MGGAKVDGFAEVVLGGEVVFFEDSAFAKVGYDFACFDFFFDLF